MIKVARKGRHGARDDAMVGMMFEHAYRVSELCQARLSLATSNKMHAVGEERACEMGKLT